MVKGINAKILKSRSTERERHSKLRKAGRINEQFPYTKSIKRKGNRK